MMYLQTICNMEHCDFTLNVMGVFTKSAATFDVIVYNEKVLKVQGAITVTSFVPKICAVVINLF